MNKPLLLFFTIILSLPLFAQTSLVPENYELKIVKNIKKHDSNVGNWINWLEDPSLYKGKAQAKN